MMFYIHSNGQSSTQRHMYPQQQPPLMPSLNSSYPNSMMPSSASVSYPYNFLNQQSQGVALPSNAHGSQWQNEICALNSRNFLNPTWMGNQNQAPSRQYIHNRNSKCFSSPCSKKRGSMYNFRMARKILQVI